jgi:hypothetical protein
VNHNPSPSRACDVCARALDGLHWRARRHPGACTRAHNARRSRVARAEGRALSTHAPRCAVFVRECEQCLRVFTARGNRARTCEAPECRLAFDRARARDFRASWRTEHGAAYTTAAIRDRKKDHSAARRAAERGARVEPVSKLEIYARDGWLCGFCGDPVDRGVEWPHPRSASLDHVVPLALGGEHSPSNVRLAHLSCNVSHGARIRRTARGSQSPSAE